MSLDRRRIPKHIHSAESKTLHAARCATKGGATGCDTSRWHTQVEMTDTVLDEINHDDAFERYVQTVWKQHARAIPRFLELEKQTRTAGRPPGSAFSHFDDLVIATECTSTGPSWDRWRALPSTEKERCRLFSIVAFKWELP